MKQIQIWLRRGWQAHTIRLAAVFLAIIMCMSLAFSAALYSAASNQLDSQLPTSGFIDIDGLFQPSQRIQNFLGDHIKNGKKVILIKLVTLNIFTLVIGAVISWLLARQTLRPIEQSVQAQTQFVSDASHELKTPLTAIRATNEVALRNKKLTLPEAKEVIAANIEDVARLHKMTMVLLDLASQGKDLAIRPVALPDVVSIALTISATNAGLNNVTIDDKTKPVMIMADADIAAQALSALIDNAIKYSPDGGTVTLKSSNKRGFVGVEVIDQGHGIATGELAHIFDRFYRGDSSRSSHNDGGYGLGLALVKKIMDSHHGSVTVTSKLGEGSTFTLLFRSIRK